MALKHLVSLQARTRPSVQTEVDLHTSTDKHKTNDHKSTHQYPNYVNSAQYGTNREHNTQDDPKDVTESKSSQEYTTVKPSPHRMNTRSSGRIGMVGGVELLVDSEIVLSSRYSKSRVFIRKTLSTMTTYQQDLLWIETVQSVPVRTGTGDTGPPLATETHPGVPS